MARLTRYEQELKPLFESMAHSIGFTDYVYNSKDTILFAEQRSFKTKTEKPDNELAKEIVTHIYENGGNVEGRYFM